MKFINEDQYTIDESVKTLVKKVIVKNNMPVSDDTRYFYIYNNYTKLNTYTGIVVAKLGNIIGISYIKNGNTFNNNGPGYISFEIKTYDGEDEYIPLYESYAYNGQRVCSRYKSHIETESIILDETHLESNFYRLKLLKKNSVTEEVLWIK